MLEIFQSCIIMHNYLFTESVAIHLTIVQTTLVHCADYSGPLCRLLWSIVQTTLVHCADYSGPLCRLLWSIVQTTLVTINDAKTGIVYFCLFGGSPRFLFCLLYANYTRSDVRSEGVMVASDFH